MIAPDRSFADMTSTLTDLVVDHEAGSVPAHKLMILSVHSSWAELTAVTHNRARGNSMLKE